MLSTKHNNVISKSLFKDVDAYCKLRIERVSIVQSNNEHVQFNVRKMISEYVETQQKNGKIENFKIICDKRNNNTASIAQGVKFEIIVIYKQTNCLRPTTLQYRLI